jgi:hypothetical protein
VSRDGPTRAGFPGLDALQEEVPMKDMILEIAAPLVVSLITAAVAAAADQRVAIGEVPDPVVHAVKAMYPAGVILDKTEKDVEHGTSI